MAALAGLGKRAGPAHMGGMTKSLITHLAFLILCLAVGAAGGWATSLSVHDWYLTLAKPPCNPPGWVFGPVWTALYVMMAVAAARVFLRRGWGREMWLFLAQLALNCLWSFLFFALKSPGLALLDIFPLWLLILLTLKACWPVDRLSGGLLVPYLAWVSFAIVLNASIWWLN